MSREWSDDLPAFGGPISAICAAPSGRMTSSRASAGAALLGPLELVGKLFDAPLDVALEMIRPFVLRNDTQHLPQPFQALAGVTRFAERGLGGPILGREVRGHDGNDYSGRGEAESGDSCEQRAQSSHRSARRSQPSRFCASCMYTRIAVSHCGMTMCSSGLPVLA